MQWLKGLTDYERVGVPDGSGIAGTSTSFPLSRMRRLLQCMGSPQRAFRIVHVAGSKGKGSVSAMLSSILYEAGLRVGTYSSPHVVTMRERIAIDGRLLVPGELTRLVSKYRSAIEAQNLLEVALH